MKQQTRPIELLAPAKNLQVGKAAIDCGADAVYIGAPKYGARYGASNSVGDIRELADYAHRFNARVYVTVNTLVYENEIGDAESLIHELYMAGADALIVQDMAVLKMNLPPIPLHASTQCDLRTVDKAKMLEALGFSQLVLARELSSQEISDIHSNVKVALEAFVHGALCVSYSGRCQASQC
ncbi:MAG: U32 family peptidase, partial [Bacteroidaceae bacterium]|nr:U32 family peptidase [Bacteroidaceae bacterium]